MITTTVTTTVRFTLAYWCLLVAALLPLICSVLAKYGKAGVPLDQGGFDNNNPRTWLAKQVDWRARANAAQANTLEALPFLMAAVIIAHLLGTPQGRLDIMAFIWIVLRILYIMAYVAGQGTIRSTLWGLAFAVNIGILLIGYR